MEFIKAAAPIVASIQETRTEIPHTDGYNNYHSIPAENDDGGQKINCAIIVQKKFRSR
jgi:hypothetical protein